MPGWRNECPHAQTRGTLARWGMRLRIHRVLPARSYECGGSCVPGPATLCPAGRHDCLTLGPAPSCCDPGPQSALLRVLSGQGYSEHSSHSKRWPGLWSAWCASPGLRSSDGGGDTPSSVSSESNSVACDEQGMSYPVGSADDEASVEWFIQHNFIQRFKQGYQEAGIVSSGDRKPAKLN